MEFKAFQKIPRWQREVCITEKIDGTNAVVAIDQDGKVWAGSRNRWVTPEDDNYGFAAWVKSNEEDLKKLGPGYHYGEWWGRGIQRGYGTQDRFFSLFSTDRWGDKDKRPACCDVVPVLYNWVYDSTVVANCTNRLRVEGSVAVPGWDRPEGVIIYHRASKQLFKYTLDGDGNKEAHVGAPTAPGWTRAPAPPRQMAVLPHIPPVPAGVRMMFEGRSYQWLTDRLLNAQSSAYGATALFRQYAANYHRARVIALTSSYVPGASACGEFTSTPEGRNIAMYLINCVENTLPLPTLAPVATATVTL